MSSTKEIIIDDFFEGLHSPNTIVTKDNGHVVLSDIFFLQILTIFCEENDVTISDLVGLPIKISVINGLAFGISFPEQLKNRLYNLKSLIIRR